MVSDISQQRGGNTSEGNSETDGDSGGEADVIAEQLLSHYHGYGETPVQKQGSRDQKGHGGSGGVGHGEGCKNL